MENQHFAHASKFPLLSAEKKHALQKNPHQLSAQKWAFIFRPMCEFASASERGNSTLNKRSSRRTESVAGTQTQHEVAWHHKPVLPCHTLERNFRNSARFLDSCGGTEWRVRESRAKQQIQQRDVRAVQTTSNHTPHSWFMIFVLWRFKNSEKTVTSQAWSQSGITQ